MKTDALIALLAADGCAVREPTSRRRFMVALGVGALAACALVLATLGARGDLAAAALLPMFWLKLAFPMLLALASGLALYRQSIPGMQPGHAMLGLALPVAALWLFALLVLVDAPAGARGALIFGNTWRECPQAIALVSIPAFAAALWAVRGLAPTHLALAGAAAGLFAGAAGALAYALHCPELEAPFLAVWYVLGMLIPTAVGAVLGPRLLRW